MRTLLKYELADGRGPNLLRRLVEGLVKLLGVTAVKVVHHGDEPRRVGIVAVALGSNTNPIGAVRIPSSASNSSSSRQRRAAP